MKIINESLITKIGAAYEVISPLASGGGEVHKDHTRRDQVRLKHA